MIENKRRGKKATLNQMELIVDCLSTDKIFTTSKCHPSQPNELDQKWEELSKRLNLEPGANKTVKQWRTFVSEWKSRVRKKAQNFHQNLVRTGGGAYIHEDLSELENKLMGAIGWLTVTGNEELPQEIDPEEPVYNVEIVKNGSRDEDPAAEEEMIDIADEEAEEEHLPQNVFITGTQRTVPRRRKRARYETNKTQLQKSPELYSNSANQLSTAVSQLSGSINLLASAISKFADVLSTRQL